MFYAKIGSQIIKSRAIKSDLIYIFEGQSCDSNLWKELRI